MSGQLCLLAAMSLVLAEDRPPETRGLPNVGELSAEAGFPSTSHTVTTEDGYRLWLFRIGNSTGPPVLMQHGIFNAADIWINRGADKDLAFLLVKAGYDVYLGNSRGNVFGKRHVKYNTADPRFWDFSFHENGYYDVPAMIDKILELRQTKQLFYIGYSLGTTMFFVMSSTRPEYNRKVRACVLLAPVGNTTPFSELHITILRYPTMISQPILIVGNSLHWHEVFPRHAFTVGLTQRFCSPNSPMVYLCLDLIGDIAGENRANIEMEALGYHMSFTPAGSSLKNLIHLAQIYKTNNFSMIDLGRTKNEAIYGSPEPPQYPLERITCPVALFWGKNDKIVSEDSVKKTASRLANLIIEEAVEDPKFTHFDVIYGKNSKDALYDKVINVIKDFT